MKLSDKDLEDIKKMKVTYSEKIHPNGSLCGSKMTGYFTDSGDHEVGIGTSFIDFEIKTDCFGIEDMKFLKWLILVAFKEMSSGCIRDEIDDEEEYKVMEELYGDGGDKE